MGRYPICRRKQGLEMRVYAGFAGLPIKLSVGAGLMRTVTAMRAWVFVIAVEIVLDALAQPREFQKVGVYSGPANLAKLCIALRTRRATRKFYARMAFHEPLPAFPTGPGSSAAATASA